MKKIKIHRWFTSLLFVILISGLALGGCSRLQAISLKSSTNDSQTETTSITAQASSLTMKNYLPRLEGTAKVVLTVNGSPITIEVNGNDAPITAGNFIDLVERGFYNGLVFHRVVKEPQPFVAQGGDPKGNGTGNFIDPETSQPRYIPLEIKLEGDEEPTYSKGLGRQAGISAPSVVLKHTRGAVAMARSQMPDSASSQFYFALSDLEFLDGDYAVFGYVTEGIDIVDRIKQGDRIQSAKVTEGLENLKK
ncbi:MAG: peptidylprolyl isomerase [Xenococcaceae cyanobacterium]